jgi:hypothetical protein
MAGVAALLFAGDPPPAGAYIAAYPPTLGKMCSWSTHIVVVKVDKVKKDGKGGVIVYRKVRDLKGKWPTERIKHVIPTDGRIQVGPTKDDTLPLGTDIIDWAEPGKRTVLFALQEHGWFHAYIDGLWYAGHTAGKKFPDWEWWHVTNDMPVLLRNFSGRRDQLEAAVGAIRAGKEVVVPCLADGKAEQLRRHRVKVQRLRAGLKRLDYDPKRDFVGWGSAEGVVVGFERGDLLVKVAGKAERVRLAGVEVLGADGKPLKGPAVAGLLKKDTEVELTERAGKVVQVKLKK